jgi:hypothetical protein
MNARHLILAASISTILAARGQDLTPKDPEPSAEPFKLLDSGRKKNSGVSVVLDDPSSPFTAPELSEKSPVPPATDESGPQLITGKPPEHSNSFKTASPENTDPEKGIAVQVEKLQSGKGPVDPKTVKLLAPFPAKPLSEPPPGWMLDASGKAPDIIREIELSSGSKITLSVRPHVLVPVVDSVTQFGIEEPGFDASLGFHQPATVGTILSTSINQLDEDSKQLGSAIDRLQQLLISLPTPSPTSPVAAPMKEGSLPKKR